MLTDENVFYFHFELYVFYTSVAKRNTFFYLGS